MRNYVTNIRINTQVITAVMELGVDAKPQNVSSRHACTYVDMYSPMYISTDGKHTASVAYKMGSRGTKIIL